MDLADKKFHTLQGVKLIVANYVVYWHKLAVDSMIFIMTGCTALTGFALSRTNEIHQSLIAISFLIIVFSMIGARLCVLIENKTEMHRDILAKLDNIDFLLEKDFYIEGDSIYPQEWKIVGKNRLKDPIFRFCFWLQLTLPFLLVLVIYFTCW